MSPPPRRLIEYTIERRRKEKGENIFIKSRFRFHKKDKKKSFIESWWWWLFLLALHRLLLDAMTRRRRRKCRVIRRVLLRRRRRCYKRWFDTWRYTWLARGSLFFHAVAREIIACEYSSTQTFEYRVTAAGSIYSPLSVSLPLQSVSFSSPQVVRNDSNWKQ